MFSYFLLGFLLLSMLAPVVFDNAGVVKAEDVWNYRRQIDINASPYISADVNAVPILIKFDSTNQSDMFGTGEDGDSIKFTSDEAGTTQLAHECVWYKDTNSGFYVKVNLDNDSQYTPIYVWYGTPAITGTESKTNVWTNGIAIYHFEETSGDVVDSMGSYSSSTYSLSDRSETGLVGNCYNFNGSSDYITVGSTSAFKAIHSSTGDFTVLGWAYWDDRGGSEQFGSFFNNVANATETGFRFLFGNSAVWGHTNQTEFLTAKSTSAWITNFKSASNAIPSADYALFSWRGSGSTAYIDKNGVNSNSGSRGTGTTADSTRAPRIGASHLDSQFFDGRIDEFWAFSDAKSLDWLKVVYNNVVNYSTFVTIDGAVNVGNSAPNKPTITRIGSVATNASNVDDEDASLDFLLTLKGYNSSDPDGDDQSFRWTIAYNYDNLYTTPDYNIGWKNANAGADINLSFTDDINKKNTLYFGLTAKDPDGETNSTFWKMTVINNAPNAVSLDSPADSSSTRDTTPTFNWTLASPEDDDGDNVFYLVRVYDSGGNLDYNSGWVDGDTTATATELELGEYTWKVVAYDWYNNSYYDTTNSSTRTLTLIANSAPNTPVITRIGGVTEVNGTVFDENTGTSSFLLNLKGYNASDPDGDNMSHRWSWASSYSNLYSTPDGNSAWLDNPADINSSTITTALTKNAYWYIGLESKDDYAGAKSHSHWKVYLDNKAPTAGTLSAPADSSETYDTTPTFEWGVGSDDDGDTLTMQVKVYDASGNLDYNNTFGSGTSATPAGALDLGTYTWRVRYFDGYDYTNSSDWTVTIIENTIPNKPTITSIGNSNVNATIYDEDSGAGFQLTRKGYNSSDYDGDVQKFKWEVDNDSDFSSPLITVDNLASGDVNGTFTTPLVKNNYYYFRLGAIDPLGANDYNYSNPIFKMYIGNRVPSKPVVTAPSGETYDTTPNITWNASTDGDGDDFNYCVVVKDTATNVDYNSGYLSTVTSPHTVSTPLDLDSYSVYVYVYDGYDSNVSEAGSFKVIANTPPNKAVINTIGGVASGNNMYDEDSGAGFKLTMDGTNSSDYDGDAQQWAWIVDDDSGFGSIDYNSTYDTPIDIEWTTALQKNKTWYFRVDAIDPLGSNTVNSSATFTGTMENYAPNAVTLTTPADSSETYDTTPTFNWTLASPEDDDGDNVYYAVLVYDGEGNLDFNSGFEDGIVEHNATALDLDTYTWKVVAYDNDGTYYYDKTNSSVRTLTIIENTIPNKPTITSIGGETTNTTIYDEDSGATFQITVKGYNSSDYDGDNQTFKWEVDNNSNFGSPEITLTDIESDINTTLTDSLTKKVDYYFRLGAIDPAGANDYNYSSPIFKITLGNRYPTKPVVTAPLTTTYDTTPAISWTNSSDTDGDAIQYRVEISNSSGVVRQSAWGVSQPYANATALDVGDYNITITAYDGYDTNASANELFTVIANTPPNKPTITTIGGEANASTIYDEDVGAGFQITLAGYNSSDTDGDLQNFKWDVDNDADFSSPLFTVDTLGSADINRTMTTALTKNTYYWFRLGAIDPAGANDYNYSTAFYMYLENKAPTAGTLSSPTDASTTYDTTPTFEWTAGSDDDGDTVTKQVKVYDASGNLDYNNTFGSDLTATSGVLDLGTYTWRVRYYDGYDYTNSSDYTLTIIENTAPNKAVITTVAGEVNASIIYDQDSTAGFKIVLNGTNSSDPDGDAQKWAWIIDDNADFGSIDYNSGYVTPIDYDWTTALTKNKVWYFRVDAIDPLGSGEANVSGMYKYTLNNKVPTAGSLTSPTDSATTYDTTPTFEWGVGSDDDGDTLTMQVKVYDSEGNLDYNNTFGALTTATPAGALDLGAYTWLVRYYDGYAYTNSSTWSFTLIANTAPLKPTITLIGGSDTNGSTIYDTDAGSGFAIALKGYNSSDPDGDDQSFGWLIDDDGTFGSPAYDTRWFASHGDINASMTTALTKKTWYYFRLDAKDPLGSDTVASSLIRKHYVGNYVPSAPVVTAPTTTTSDTTPNITWTNSSDIDGDALTYRVEISNASGVVRQSAWGVSQPYTNSTALSVGEYNVTIYVYDTYDTNSSAKELFEVIAVAPPTMPVLTYPEAWAIRTLGTTHFNWTDSIDPEGDPFTYTMYIESQAMTGQFIVKSGLTTSDYNAGDLDLLECHTYRWKVQAVQTDDNSTLGYTDWSYFQVDCTDVYEIKIISAFNSGTSNVDVIMWLEKNGQIMTDVSAPSLVMKDYANATVTTLDGGSVYADGIYRDAYVITGGEAGLYTLKGTLTYNGIVYYGVGVFDSNTKEIRDLISALVVGSGADQYQVKMTGAYDKASGRVEVIAWIQKNGIMETGISSVTIVMKDDANTTVHTFNSGTVYSDGFYRETWDTSGLHGLYSLKGTLTYSGKSYAGGSYFDAGIMEVHDALSSISTTIGLIDTKLDTMHAKLNSTYTDVQTIKGYVGTPADLSSANTLFGYSQYLKDKWGTYTAEIIYNKVVDVYDLVDDMNVTFDDSTIVALQTTVDDLDTYIRTYSGVDISVGTTYNFYSDQLELSVAYIKDGEIKNTASCTTLVKDSTGAVLKTFNEADDADNIYRYDWNKSALDFPANGFYGSYTIIPSVVYNGNTYTTVRTFNAELPDLYGTTAYTDTLEVYSDSGYSVTTNTANAGTYIYLKCTSTTAMSDLSNVTYSVYWEDTDGNILATTSGTGRVSSNSMRIPLTVPIFSGNIRLRLYAYQTVYGHRNTTMSGTSNAIVVYNYIGTGYNQPINSAEIRIAPDTIKAGDTIKLGFVCERRGGVEAVGIATVRLIDVKENIVKTEDYAITMKEKITDVMLDFKTPVTMAKGVYKLQVLRDGFVLDTHDITVSETVPSGGTIIEAIKRFRWEIPGTDIVISFE